MALEQARIVFGEEEPVTSGSPTIISPLSYLQVGQQLFNRELAQPEINYLQSLYGQDVDPTEMGALQKALAPNEAIGGLYQSVLGRTPDPFGQMYWASQFGSEISPEERAAFEQAAAAEIAARPKPAAGPVLSADTSALSTATSSSSDLDLSSIPGAYVTSAGNYWDPNSRTFVNPIGKNDKFPAHYPKEGGMFYPDLGRYMSNEERLSKESAGFNPTANRKPVSAETIDLGNGFEKIIQTYSDGSITEQIGPKSESSALPYFLAVASAGAGGSGLFESLGNYLSGGALTGTSATALGSSALNFASQVAKGADPLDALKGSVLTYGAGELANQIGSMVPNEFQSLAKNTITQLVTTGKIDPQSLLTSTGLSLASDALASETGLDKATAGKLINAGMQAYKGNEFGALSTLGQLAINSRAGTGVSAQSPQDRDAFLEANASPLGVGALSPIPAEDEQIDLQQRVNNANQAISDYVGPGNDLSREGLVSQLQTFGFTADQAEGYAKQADQQINMQRVGADVMNRYSKIDPEFGTPQLDRDTAVQEMVLAGFTSQRANEILNGIDAQNAIKRENKLSVMSAYDKLTKGTGTQDELRSAMTSAGYTDAEINSTITRGLGVLEGSKLTAGEQVQERASQLPDVRAQIAEKPTFNEAYAFAREKLGANATFTWQGKSYSTATVEERPDLTGKATDKAAPENQKSLDLTGATEWELNLMRKPLGFDANNATTARLMSPQEFKSLMSDPKLGIDPNTLDQRYQAYLYSQAPRVNAGQRASLPIELAYRPPADIYENPPTSFDEFKNTVLGGVAAGSKVASDAQNVINSLTSNLAALAPSIVSGVAASVTGDAENGVSSALRRIADIASSSSEVIVPELALGAQNISNAVSDAQGWGKVGALLNAVVDNPGAAMWWIAKEGSEELIPIAAAAKVLQATGSLRAAAMADGILSFVETQGLTQEELIKGFQDLGLTSTQAAQAASPGAFAAGAAESIISPLVDLPVIKLLAREGSDAGQTVSKRILSIIGSDVKETLGESLQEGAGSVAKQLATTGKVNTNEALTDAVLGGFVGGKTSAGMTTLEALSQPGVLSGAVQESINKLGNPGVTAITSSVLKVNPDPSSAGQILLAAQGNGVNLNDAVANILQGANTSGIQMPGVFVSLSTALQNTGLTEADANQLVVDAASNISTDLGSLALTATKKTSPGLGSSTVPSAGPSAGPTDYGRGPSALDMQNLLASQGSQVPSGKPTGGSQLPVGGLSTQVPGGPATLIPSGPSTQVPSTSGAPITQIPGGVSTEPAVKSQAQIEAEARAASQADLNSRTYKGQIYPTVEAASEARLADSAPGAQQATRADLEATLKGMGLTPTKEAMDSLLSGNPTNDQLLTRLRSAPDLLASLKPATSGTSASLATETKPEGGPTIVTEGDTTIITETVGDTKSQTQINGNTIKQVNTDLNTGAESTFTSNGNQNSQLIVTDGLTLNVSTDKNANITVSVKDSDDGLVTVVKTQTGGNVSILNNDGSTSETLVDGNIIVNTNNNTLIKTFLDTKTNTFTVVTGLDETIGGGSVDDLDPVVSDDIFRGLSELSFVQPVPDLQVPAVAVEPPQVTPPKEPVKEPKKEPPKKPTPQPSGGGAGALLATGASGELGRLLGQMLEAKVTDEKYIDPLANLPKLTQEAPPMNNDPRLERYLDERGPDPDSNYYSYGKVPSLDEILGGQVMAQGGQVMPLPFMYAKGGLSRQDFRQGKHVSGPGDGQSDDIPAMLADGEFVFPADVVAALGNGSTKAGTQKLYEMMHAIRQRARSTKVKDLPPPALKSPLDYLKSRK